MTLGEPELELAAFPQVSASKTLYFDLKQEESDSSSCWKGMDAPQWRPALDNRAFCGATEKGVEMNLVYNSEHYAILAYPVREGFELVDKLGKRSLFVQGSVAVGLRLAIDSIPDEERDMESIDSLLDDYCVGAAKPISFH